jgi:hypothetical protein
MPPYFKMCHIIDFGCQNEVKAKIAINVMTGDQILDYKLKGSIL